jgi:hypothetical protein
LVGDEWKEVLHDFDLLFVDGCSDLSISSGPALLIAIVGGRFIILNLDKGQLSSAELFMVLFDLFRLFMKSGIEVDFSIELFLWVRDYVL